MPSRAYQSKEKSTSSVRQINTENIASKKVLEKDGQQSISSKNYKKIEKDVQNNKISDKVSESNKLNKSMKTTVNIKEGGEKMTKRQIKISEPLLTPIVKRHLSNRKEKIGKTKRTPKDKETQVELEYKDSATEMSIISDDKVTQVEHLDLMDFRSCSTQTQKNVDVVNGSR